MWKIDQFGKIDQFFVSFTFDYHSCLPTADNTNGDFISFNSLIIYLSNHIYLVRIYIPQKYDIIYSHVIFT